MSRARAEIWTRDGVLVAHAIYDGTSDVLTPNMATTAREAWAYYDGDLERVDRLDPWDDCDHQLLPGYAWSDYGGGFHWPIHYCPACRRIDGPLDWDGTYDLEPVGAWPKDGRPPIDATTTHRALPGPS